MNPKPEAKPGIRLGVTPPSWEAAASPASPPASDMTTTVVREGFMPAARAALRPELKRSSLD